MSDVRVRFCPSPTGNPHVGAIRTCLFNWAYARHVGGTFVFRIEDTDSARDSEEAYTAMLESLRWLGLDWDEGPEIGGPHEPYRQSQRMDIYRDVVAKLLAAGHLYESFSTADESVERRKARGEDPQLGYDNYDRTLTEEQKAAFRAEGREATLRLRMPDEDLTWNDLVRGEVTFAAGQVADFVVVRANGEPLYTLVNPVDDALMRITHVLRGEDLLPSTPRQIALYRALIDIGVADSIPQFGHLPYVMGEGNKKLSKRDPNASFMLYREQGYVPEGLLNYLALLGWSIAADRDLFSMTEMAEAFDITDVNANPARFDPKKCLAINAEWIRRLEIADFTARLRPYVESAGLPLNDEVIGAAAPLVQTRCNTLSEAASKLGYLLNDAITMDEAAKAKSVDTEQGQAVVAATVAALEAQDDWTAEPIHEALNAALLEDGLGLKPKQAFGPLYVALSGSSSALPLFDSMQILGKDVTLARLRATLGG
jgi:glutamyl-tRNA synthetase